MIYRHSHTYIHLETVFFAGEDEKEEYFFLFNPPNPRISEI